MRIVTVVIAAGSGSFGVLQAQSILRSPRGTVEVVGLNRWTIPMIQDSMHKYAPGENLASHACAAVLRYKLHFAEAAATTMIGYPYTDTLEHVFVAVVEPQDSARVHHRPMPYDSTAGYAPWGKIVALVDRSPAIPEASVNSYLTWRVDSARVEKTGRAALDADIALYRAELASRTTERDYRTAIRMLRTNRDFRVRVVAATILLNFVARDSALYALVDAVREPDGMVVGLAGAVLNEVANGTPKRVNWRPAAKSLHAILDGTQPFELSAVMRLVAKTGADTALARPLLKKGGSMILAYAGAETPIPRQEAIYLLTQLAGRDLGSAAAWKAWVEAL